MKCCVHRKDPGLARFTKIGELAIEVLANAVSKRKEKRTTLARVAKVIDQGHLIPGQELSIVRSIPDLGASEEAKVARSILPSTPR